MGSILLHCATMGAPENRRANLIKLIENYGTIEQFAEMADQSAGYLSQIKNGTRNMGTRIARKIEQAMGLADGWMDADQSGSLSLVTSPPPPELAYFRKLTKQQREAVVVILQAMIAKNK